MGNYDPDKIHPVTTVKTKLGLSTNIAATLCYVPIPAIGIVVPAVWLVSEPKDNYFLRFHSAQGLVLSVGYGVTATAVWVASLLFAFVPVVGGFFTGILGLVGFLLTGAFFITGLFLMYSAFNNRLVKLPLLSNVADTVLAKADRI